MVPPTLISRSCRGSATDLRTSICAARWKTTSASVSIGSVIDPSISRAAGLTFSRRPVLRSSSTVTSSPRATRASTTWDPMKPAPPVTSARIGAVCATRGCREVLHWAWCAGSSSCSSRVSSRRRRRRTPRRSRSRSRCGARSRDAVAFDTYADLGVGLFQHTMSWAAVAPTRPLDPRNPDDPAYQWPADIDAAIAEGGAARHRGLADAHLGAPVGQRGPRAALGADEGRATSRTSPRPPPKRYPAIRHWMIWSEPTKASNFQPLDPDRGPPAEGRLAAGRAQVRPDPRRQLRRAEGSAAQQPRHRRQHLHRRDRRAAALDPRDAPARRAPPAHGPVGPQPVQRARAEAERPAARRRLRRLLRPRRARRRSSTAPIAGRRCKRERHLKLFLSEYSLPTDHANFEFNFFVTRSQAGRLARARRCGIARTYKRIYTLGYLASTTTARARTASRSSAGCSRATASASPPTRPIATTRSRGGGRSTRSPRPAAAPTAPPRRW